MTGTLCDYFYYGIDASFNDQLLTMKTVIIFINGKGGVSKSTCCDHCSQYQSSVGRVHQLIDADSEPKRPGTIKRLHPGAEEYIAGLDPKGQRMYDRLFEAALESPLVLADLGAGVTDHFLTWFRESDLLANLDEAGINMVLAVPVYENLDSVIGLKTLWDGAGADAQKHLSWVVIRNWMKGEPQRYLSSKVREELLSAGAEEMDFEAFNFPADVAAVLDGNRDRRDGQFITMSSAISTGVFSTLKTARLRNYQKRLFAEFAKVKAFNPG